MNVQAFGAAPWLPVVSAGAGVVFGWGYFAALRRAVALFTANHAALWSVLFLIGRVGAAALFFACIVRWGAAALLAAFLGFLAARHLAVRSARRAT
jgi:hypothetical protein